MKKKLLQFGWTMPQKQILIFFVGLFVALSSVSGQVTFSAGGLPAAIPDPGNLTNTVTVSGIPGTVATADEVQINVEISHAWASDIIIGVTPPGGTEVIIVNRIGGGMNIDMAAGNVLSFRSNAAAVVTVPGLNGVIPAGIYLPSGANAVGSFSSLIGATRNGNWTIRVRDDDSIIQGSLQSASITFFGVGSACPNPPTASVSTQPTCAVPTGIVTVTAPANGAGVSYTLTGTSPVVAAATNSTGVFSGLAAGTYEVVSIVSGCTSPATTLVVNAAPAPTTYYADVDQDGFGNPNNTTQACSQPGGYVTNNTDCNDLSAVEKPGQVWYKDTDGDNYAQTGAATITQCLRPVGYKAASELTSTTGDCNDGNAAIKPGATEVCDGVDNNCDGTIDNVPSGNGTWSNANVGTANGEADYPACDAKPNDVFTIEASGFSTSSSDKLHLVYQQLCGNIELIARVTGVTNGGWGGITLRETLMPGSKKVVLKTQSNGNIRREIRSTTNGATSNLNYLRPTHSWLRLVRSGSNFVGYTSTNGSTWTFAFSATVSMTGCIYVGLFSESINTNVVTTATFDQVQVNGGTTPLLIEAPHTTAAASTLVPDVYPNPSFGEVNIDLSGYADPLGTVRVFDVFGQLVKAVRLDGTSLFRMDMDGADGVYFLSIEVDGMEPVTKRVVLAR